MSQPFLATTTHQWITVCHYMVCYLLLHYSALFLWVFPYFTHTRALFPCHTYYSFCFYHVALFSFIYTIFSVACFHGVLLPSYTFYNFFFFFFFFCTTFFFVALLFFDVALFSYSVSFMLYFFMLRF